MTNAADIQAAVEAAREVTFVTRVRGRHVVRLDLKKSAARTLAAIAGADLYVHVSSDGGRRIILHERGLD